MEGGGGNERSEEISVATAAAALQKGTTNGELLVLAENLLEKLKLLDYDVECCYRKHQSPFTRTYFTEPAANANAQWVAFLQLAGWLMKQLGSDFNVDKYDDPNASANRMMLSLKDLGFGSDFPVSKLKQACGWSVCSVLDFLADKNLKKRGFKFKEPAYPEGESFEEAQVDDADLGQAEIVDEAIESEEEEEFFTQNARSGKRSGDGPFEGRNAGTFEGKEDDKDSGIMKGDESPEFLAAWRAELERVAPKLKQASAAAGGNEWRAHMEQTKKHESTILEILPSCTKQLRNINENLTQSLERIETKEGSLQQSFDYIGREFKLVQEKLKTVQSVHETSNEAVETLSNELSAVSEALDELKDNMDSRGNSMVDTSPLQKIRKALTKLKSEIKQMELRIGVVSQSLLQASLKNAHDGRKKKSNNIDVVSPASEQTSPLPSGYNF